MKSFAGKAANEEEAKRCDRSGRRDAAEASRLEVTINCTLTALRFHSSVGDIATKPAAMRHCLGAPAERLTN